MFLRNFRKISNTRFHLKIHPVGAKLFLADGRTDMTKLTAKSACKRWAIQQKSI